VTGPDHHHRVLTRRGPAFGSLAPEPASYNRRIDPADARTDADARPRWRRIQLSDRHVDLVTIGVLVLLTIPLIVTLISVSRETWYPTGDMAQAELHVAGFFRHPPLVGAAGRIADTAPPFTQGSHPGPALWFALLPFYLLTLRSSFGLELGMTVMQLAFLVATVWFVRRLAGRIAGLLAAVIGAVLVYSLGPPVFIEPWNPWGGVFAFFCFIALCWGITCGHHRWLPAAAFCGWFAVQCHTGYIVLVGAGLAGMVVVLVVDWRRRKPPGIWRSWWIAVGVSVVMWLPPLIDQLRRSPGNLRILLHHFTATHEADGTPRAFVGLGKAVKAFATEIALPGPWLGDFHQPSDSPNVIGLLASIAVVAGAVWLLRSSRDGRITRLLILVGGFTIVGIISTARVFGEFYDYVIRWWWVIAAWLFFACVLVFIARLRRELVVAGAVVVAVLMSCLATAQAVGTQNPGPRNSRIVGGLDAIVRPQLDHGYRYLIRWYDPATLGGVPFGVLLDLESHGFHAGVDPVYAAGALPHRVLPEASANAVLWIVLGDANIALMRERADATELGYFDQRSADEVVRSDALRQQLIDRLVGLGLECKVPLIDQQYGLAQLFLNTVDIALPPDVAQLAADYNAYGLPAAAFLLPPESPPFVAPTATC
jgi:hypothetical protein